MGRNLNLFIMPQGLVKNNPANDPDKKPVKARSHFKPNVSIYQTARFGEVTPFYGAEIVPDDENVSIRVNSDVDTLTLKSPLMAPLRMNKDYFFAPLRAILPYNADRLVTNPLTGDDVVAENVNCVIRPDDILRFINPRISNTPTYLLDLIKQVGSYDSTTYPISADSSVTHFIGYFLSFYRKAWMFLSEGSPARNFGFNFHQLFIGPHRDPTLPRLTFDEWSEEYFDWIRTYVHQFDITLLTGVELGSNSQVPYAFQSQAFTVVPDVSAPHNFSNTVIDVRQLVYLLQQGAVPSKIDHLYLTAAGTSLGNDILPFNPWPEQSLSVWNDFNVGIFQTAQHGAPVLYDDQKFYNFSRLVAYQLSCAQFYSSDAVDYVYSPELWHENQLTLLSYSSSVQKMTYDYNGLGVRYDSVSHEPIRVGAIHAYQYPGLSGLESSSSPSEWERYVLTSAGSPSAETYAVNFEFYLSNIFGFVRSLKFRDYFVGSKKSPMAVGNVNVTVTAGQFSVVDVTANILRQRFLNQVNRVGRTLKEYSQGIFGASPMRDPHEVVFLGSTTDIIGAQETQNTGSEQRDRFSLTSRLRSESSKFAFEGSFDEYGVVVGLLSFDVARPYVNNADRPLFHVDRFDMFNPFMQNIGDQAVFGEEVDLHQHLANFGYQLRYMEYRQRVDYAAGGFHKYLPGYAFLADQRDIANPGSYNIQISPDFIRSRSYEFDDVYQALPFYSPAGYFHFIIRHDVEVDMNRPMLAAPSIL